MERIADIGVIVILGDSVTDLVTGDALRKD